MELSASKSAILIQEPASSEWGKQADSLSQALNQLAADPSTKNLLLAQALCDRSALNFKMDATASTAATLSSPGMGQPFLQRLSVIALWGADTCNWVFDAM
jgi:hypothetical protein